jgi:hypothetical protein
MGMRALSMLLWIYAWPHAPADAPLAARFVPPAGTAPVAVAEDSFGAFLRQLPLLPEGTKVHLYDGTLKARQDVHAAVVDLDVPPRDLQQWADAVMRLWAEYRFARGLPIAFHPDPGGRRVLTFTGGDRRAFARWLIRVFADAGSASLQAELRAAADPVAPGDVLIQGGYPGHAVLVLDVVVDGRGRRRMLLGQSYMPAQQFHVLVDPASGSPWFDAAALEAPSGLRTPEWRPFFARDRRRF